ncbi:MAG: hypothetical protein HOK28_09985 [Deltaproteobacteria bacterium]|nr:hypothetical protein [Deltaproteobacteria bacterium]
MHKLWHMLALLTTFTFLSACGGSDEPETCTGDDCPQAAVCGNAEVEDGEFCDDGNTSNGDYCAADCLSITAVCGDGAIGEGETCDDGDAEECGDCNATCTGSGTGVSCDDDQGIFDGSIRIDDASDLARLADYTEVTGRIEIIGLDTVNLEGLENIQTIGLDLVIQDCPNLNDISALSSLTTIGEDLFMQRNQALTSLTGLENLVTIGEYLTIQGHNNLTTLSALSNLTDLGQRNGLLENGIGITFNTALTDLQGLGGVEAIDSIVLEGNSAMTSLNGIAFTTLGYINLEDNDALTDLSALSVLTSIDGDVILEGNASLTSLAGLENVTRIEDSLKLLTTSVTSLDGLAGLVSVGANIEMRHNADLASCHIDSFVERVGAGNVAGEVKLENNNDELPCD